MITRNASRLQNLAESILQVSRIESGSFSLDIQKNVDFHNLVSQVIEDIEKKYAYKEKANKVSILFLPFDDQREQRGDSRKDVQKQRQKQKQQVQNKRKKEQQQQQRTSNPQKMARITFCTLTVTRKK